MKTDQNRDLPTTRKEQFFDCLQYQYDILLKIGIVLVVCFAPLILVDVLREMNAAAFYDELRQNQITEEQYRDLMLLSKRITGVYRIGGLLLLSLGVAGLLNIVKHICWREPISFGGCFLDGVKGNYKTCLAIFTIMGVVLFMIESLQDSAMDGFLIPAYISVWGVFFPIMMLMLCVESVYEVGFFENMKNSALLFFSTLIRTILATAVCFSPLILLALRSFSFKYLMISAVIIVFFPVGGLKWFLYCLEVFDRYINDRYPELKRRGLS